MAKNVIVIDEQGNEYEATYPKRAKGLVKSGRARFVNENKICLACPPKEYLEDKNMSQEINQKYVLEQISALQNQLQSMEKVLFQIQCISDHQTYCEKEDGEQVPLDYMPDVALAKTQVIREIFIAREQTINKMLDFYLDIWDEVDE